MQASTFNDFVATPLGFAVFFIALWCAVSFLISYIGGWFALSKRFKRQSEPYGETKSAGPFFYTVYMRWWGHYSSVVRLTAASDALYASVLFPFRVFHPPLRIPWDQIQFGRAKYFFRNYIVLNLGTEERIPMRISSRMARNLGILDRCPA
ncbi:MAG: hypothetical protein WBP85_13980 [Terracidiphilus sp.]